MTIRKSPPKLVQNNKTSYDKVIQKGGSVTGAAIQNSELPYRLSLRVPSLLKIQVNQSIALDPTRPSLTAWILGAMKQRLKQEEKDEI